MKLNSNIKIHLPKRVLILAAGFGKRLWPITKDTPKALVEINGRPALQTIIENLIKTGFKNIVVNTHYLAEQIESFVNKNFPLQITISHEEEVLETGGGILKVYRDYNYSPLLVINCDAFFTNLENAINEILTNWDPKKMDFLVALKKVEHGGDFNLTNEGKLIRDGDNKLCFTGLYIIKPEILKSVNLKKFSLARDFLLTDIIHHEHSFYGFVTDEDWLDIGTPESLKKANAMFSKLEININNYD